MPSAAALLRRAVTVVERDAPPCAAAIARALGTYTLALELDGEPAILHVANGLVVTDGRPVAPGASVATTSASIVDLLTGKDELLAAVRANRVRVRTSHAFAASCFYIMIALIEGCARSLDGPALMTEIRNRVERSRHA